LALGVVAAGSAITAVTGGANPDGAGRLVVLPDHRKLNFRCVGRGSPTVIFEAGYGADSRAWAGIQSRLRKLTRTCAYDRAGYGFSDPGPMPRDGEAIARDLDLGLKAAGLPGPYVLVGHSAGGLYARLFAARRRRDVVGLVFVDSSVEHQPQRTAEIFGPGAGGIEGIQQRALQCLHATEAPRTLANEAALLACAPQNGDPHTRQLQLRPATWRTQSSEIDNLFTTTSDEVDRIGDLLRGIPAIVLTAGKADGAAAGPEDPGEAAWQGFHRQLSQRFGHGQQRVVRSSHLMMHDRPEVVAQAVTELVLIARKR
jgi:pimeloyl-ACP methyl ester carboxylesterase